jgi:hypothetical protein
VHFSSQSLHIKVPFFSQRIRIKVPFSEVAPCPFEILARTLLMDRDEMRNLYREPSIDASYRVVPDYSNQKD